MNKHLQPEAQSTVLVSNALGQIPDEGIRRVALEIADCLTDFDIPSVEISPRDSFLSRKLLLKLTIRKSVQGKPHPTLLYIPSQSMTLGTFLRALTLKTFTRAKVIAIPCQVGSPFVGQRFLAALGPVDLVLSPSPSLIRRAESLAITARFIPLAVDTDRFHTPSEEQRRSFRIDLGIKEADKLILHVGHLRTARNLGWIKDLTSLGEVVVIAGTSRGYDPAVLRELQAGGVRTITRFIPNIQDAYAAADCYVFSVLDEKGSVAVPLSVLEAMATNCPVVTTPFGGLPQMFREEGGFFFAADQEDLTQKVSIALAMPSSEVRTRAMVEPYTWRSLAHKVIDEAASLWN
jgi:glycosyltransferase involved in cell wall biosynthesis